MRKCRICQNPCEDVFSLGNLAVSNFIPTDKPSNIYHYPLSLVFCDKCKLLQLKDTTPNDLMYGKYWYRSGINNTMKLALQDVVKSCLESIEVVDNDVFLDIACNDGTLLSYVPNNLLRIGVDPADDSYKKEAIKHANYIIQDYFSAGAYKAVYGGMKAKIVTVIAMFYDLDNPVQFLKDVYEVMDDNGLLVMQLSYTPLMIKQLAFDNICHEHLCYYSLMSLENAANRAGFKIVDCDLNSINGGSFRVYMLKFDTDKSIYRTAPERDIAELKLSAYFDNEIHWGMDRIQTYEHFYKKICDLNNTTVSFIKSEKAKGKRIWGYGASTKGNTLLQWYGLNSNIIDGIAERSPQKFGLKTAGTNIPIYSEQEMRKAKPDYLLVLPWHFISEFKKREKDYLLNGGHFIVPCPRFEVI